jgi:hypothetical protein
MPITAPPSADGITIAEVLELLENKFAAVAAVAERRGFTFWIGSGISRGRAPDVGKMLELALERLRHRVDPHDPNCKFRRALDEALGKSGIDAARRAGIRFDLPLEEWSERVEIIRGLWDRYAEVLDIRLSGEADDYMLWEAVDVRNTYGTIDDPDCEHLCIAILVMEGAIADIASPNWDGLIEAAVKRLSGGTQLLQVVVDPAHLRDEPARTRLIKFHGCAIHCIKDPTTYRRFLIATRPQITYWPHNTDLTALRTELTAVATNSRTLMIGLSLQDTNLQDLFAKARAAAPWPWPSAPSAQGHVFCEDALGPHQINMLRVVYATAYGTNQNAIEDSALLRAYGKQILLALFLHLLTEKLILLARSACAVGPLATSFEELRAALRHLRNRIAAVADGDRLAFVNVFVQFWSRGLVLFRRGDIPAPNSEKYELITPLSLQEMSADPNLLQQSGLPELAVGLALLGQGDADGKWTLSLPAALNIEHGALRAIGTWASAEARQIYFVSSAAVAIELVKRGGITRDNVLIIHSDDAWKEMSDAGLTSHRSPTGSSGRTGLLAARHVSIRNLLRAAPNLAMLKQRFEEEITL